MSDAFDALLGDYKERKLVRHGRSVFDSSSDFTFLSPFFRGVGFGKDHDFDEAVIKSIKALDHAVLIVGLGIDFRRYGKFRFLIPQFHHTNQGRYMVAKDEDYDWTLADFEYCEDFVVRAAIQLAAFDYDLPGWEQFSYPR